MKTKTILITLAFAALATIAMAAPSPKENAKTMLGVHVVTTTHQIFYFKIDNGWIGGEVDVLGEDTLPIITQKLDKKKILIDFFDLAPGTYTIVVKKAEFNQKFIYVKK